MAQACEAAEHEGLLGDWTTCFSLRQSAQLVCGQELTFAGCLAKLVVCLQGIHRVACQGSSPNGIAQHRIEVGLDEHQGLRRQWLRIVGRLRVAVFLLNIFEEVFHPCLVELRHQYAWTIYVSKVCFDDIHGAAHMPAVGIGMSVAPFQI